MLDVYKQVYHLDSQPFRLSPDHHFSFGHRTYENAKAYLKYAITEGEGIVVITGAPGTGKTTLIATLLSEIDSDIANISMLSNAQLDAGNLVRRVSNAFGLDDCDQADADLLIALESALADQYLAGGRAVLIIDEAQGLDQRMLEDLRLLTNMQYQNQLLMQLILVGHDSLLDIIREPGMEQFHQRLIAASQLEALDDEETGQYIKYRLSQAGWKGDPSISDEALNLVHKFSSGIPRRINLICHRLFLRGGLDDKHTLDGPDALHVIVELHREGLLTPVVRRNLAKVRDIRVA